MRHFGQKTATVLACLAILAGCATAPAVKNYPDEIMRVDFVPVLEGDSAEYLYGAHPVYALLSRDRTPQAAWHLLQISGRMLTPTRPNQEVLEISTDLARAWPTWSGTTIKFKVDPVTRERSNYRLDRQRAEVGVPRNVRYAPQNSAFAFQERDSDIVAGQMLLAFQWRLNTAAVREAMAQTDLIQSVREYQGGGRKFRQEYEVKPQLAGDLVWKVVMDNRQGKFFYFVPATFRSSEGDLLEEGSKVYVRLGGSIVTLDNLARLDAYSIEQGKFCASFVLQVVGQAPTKEYGCGQSWSGVSPIVAESRDLGKVLVSTLHGTVYDADGRNLGSDSLRLFSGAYLRPWSIEKVDPAQARRVLQVPAR